MHIIAIDCGASFIKIASIVDDRIVDRRIIETPKECDDTNKLDYSIEAISNAIVELSERGELLHIGISNEMHGFVLTDSKGNRLTNYVSWQNTLGNEYYRNDLTYTAYVKSIISNEAIKKTGMPIKTGQPNVSLFYIIHSIDSESVYFYTLGDYYIKMLSGKEPYIHETNAAATGIYDIVSRKWSEEIVSKLKFENVIFPEIYYKQPTLRSEISEREVLFYSAIGDQQAALLGAGLENRNDISFNFGTGAQVSMLLDKAVLSDDYQTRPFFGEKYLKTIPHIPSGRSLNVFLKLFKESMLLSENIDDESFWKSIINAATENNRPLLDMDLSFFSNAITQHEKGAIRNIGEFDLTIGNLFDSIFHQIAENALIVAQRLGMNESKKAIFSGGILRKNKYLQTLFVEKLTNIKTFITVEDETFWGIYKYICMEMSK